MPGWLQAMLPLASGALIYLVVVALLSRLRKGHLKISRTGKYRIEIHTDTGTFSLNPSSIYVTDYSGKQRKLLYDEIRGLRYGYQTEDAWITEFVLGFDLWDFFSAWADEVEWFGINIVLADNSEILLYVAGQLERREPLMGWWYELLNRAFKLVGLRDDIEQRSSLALNKVTAVFAEFGGMFG